MRILAAAIGNRPDMSTAASRISDNCAPTAVAPFLRITVYTVAASSCRAASFCGRPQGTVKVGQWAVNNNVIEIVF